MISRIFPPRRDLKISNELNQAVTDRYAVFFENLASNVNEIVEGDVTSIVDNTVSNITSQFSQILGKIKDLSYIEYYENRINRLEAVISSLNKKVSDLENLNAELQ